MVWRDATVADDRLVSQLLLATFAATNAAKRPDLVSTAERIRELEDVAGRRASGVVRILEIGRRIVGTYSLVRSGSPACVAWSERDAYLRAVAVDPEFQGIRLADSLMTDALALARAWGQGGVGLHI